MTRQEIIKEAEEQVNYCTPLYPESFIQGYVAGAESREKQIAELERKLEQTEKDLIDYQFNYPKIKDLEKQIEKMKCCGNCKHRYFIGDELECHLLDNGINCDNEDKWEIKENEL